MKKLIIIDEDSSSKINGIGTYVQKLIQISLDLNIDICVVACNHDCKEFTVKIEDGVKKILIPPVSYDYCHKIIDKFLGLYIDDSCDNLFLFNHTPLELFIKSVKKRFPLSKFGYTIHDMTWTTQLLGDTERLKSVIFDIETGDVEKKYKTLEKKYKEEQRMFDIVDVIIVLAQETFDLLQDCYNVSPEKIMFIPNGLEDSYSLVSDAEKQLLKHRMHLDNSEKIIIFVGRVCLVKGIIALISSFKNVLNVYPNCRLVVVGTVFDFSETLKLSSGIASKITFTGQIDKDALKKWYSIADIGVLPSYLEQCSYTGIEMMMNNLPVVASDGFCLKEMFKNNQNANIAQIGERENTNLFETNLTKSILELLFSEQICNKLGDGGREMYKSIYSIECMQNGYSKLFNKI